MRNASSKNKLGFSLIELSVVILVIGILVIGVTQGSRIIKEAKLKSARALTNSSPVASTTGLIMWLEATSEKSFIDGEKVNTAIGATGTISNWYDISPQTALANNATQSGASSLKPRYIDSGINGLPVLNFDGSDDFLSFDGTSLANTSYTIFFVGQRRDNSFNCFIGGTVDAVNSMLHVCYRNTNTFTFAQWNNDYDMTIASYTSPIAQMHTTMFKSGVGKEYYLNGQTVAMNSAGTNFSATTGLAAYTGAFIGRSGTGYGAIDIAEIIIFNKALTVSDRTGIESYLKTKWSIK